MNVSRSINARRVMFIPGRIFWYLALIMAGSGIYNDNGNVVLATMGTGNIRIDRKQFEQRTLP
jgi:hypothetical protein